MATIRGAMAGDLLYGTWDVDAIYGEEGDDRAADFRVEMNVRSLQSSDFVLQRNDVSCSSEEGTT